MLFLTTGSGEIRQPGTTTVIDTLCAGQHFAEVRAAAAGPPAWQGGGPGVRLLAWLC